MAAGGQVCLPAQDVRWLTKDNRHLRAIKRALSHLCRVPWRSALEAAAAFLAVFLGAGSAYSALPVDDQLLGDLTVGANEKAPIAQWAGAVAVKTDMPGEACPAQAVLPCIRGAPAQRLLLKAL